MKPHATKIFRDIVNGLGAFIQSQFVNPTQMNAITGYHLIFSQNLKLASR